MSKKNIWLIKIGILSNLPDLLLEKYCSGVFDCRLHSATVVQSVSMHHTSSRRDTKLSVLSFFLVVVLSLAFEMVLYRV